MKKAPKRTTFELMKEIVFISEYSKQNGEFVMVSPDDEPRLYKLIKEYGNIGSMVDLKGAVRSSDVQRVYDKMLLKFLGNKLRGKADSFLDPIILSLSDRNEKFLLHYTNFEKLVTIRRLCINQMITNSCWLVNTYFALSFASPLRSFAVIAFVASLLMLNFAVNLWAIYGEYKRNKEMLAITMPLIGQYLIHDLLTKIMNNFESQHAVLCLTSMVKPDIELEFEK